MRKLAFFICEISGADQMHGHHIGTDVSQLNFANFSIKH